MQTNIIRTWMLAVMLLLCSQTAAFTAEHRQPKTMQEYLQANCRKACIGTEQLLQYTKEAQDKYKVSQKLMMAVINIESNFNQRATNKSGGLSVGLAQLQIKYHKKKFTGTNYYDARENILAGAQVLGQCLSKHRGKVEKALLCYNGYSNAAYPKKVFNALSKISKLEGIDAAAAGPLTFKSRSTPRSSLQFVLNITETTSQFG